MIEGEIGQIERVSERQRESAGKISRPSIFLILRQIKNGLAFVVQCVVHNGHLLNSIGEIDFTN